MDPRANFAYSTVATAPSPASSGTSLVVAAGEGTKFPSTPFNATIWPVGVQPTTANAEIVTVTAKSTDTLTIVRTAESTSARTVVVGDQIQAGVTAKTISDVENHYLTVNDEVQAAGTQIMYDGHFEVASNYVYELASDAILTVGDFATPIIGPGYEISYTQITASVNVTSTTEATSTTIISPNPITFDGGTVLLHFFCPFIACPTNAVSAEVVVSLFEGTTEITELGPAFTYNTTAHTSNPVNAYYRFSPSAGIHTYTIAAFATNTTGTPQIGAGTGSGANFPPAFVRFTKV